MAARTKSRRGAAEGTEGRAKAMLEAGLRARETGPSPGRIGPMSPIRHTWYVIVTELRAGAYAVQPLPALDIMIVHSWRAAQTSREVAPFRNSMAYYRNLFCIHALAI